MKIMTICTIDVHARDVVAKMILAKVFVTRGYFYCVISWQSGAKISCCFMRKPHMGSRGAWELGSDEAGLGLVQSRMEERRCWLPPCTVGAGGLGAGLSAAVGGCGVGWAAWWKGPHPPQRCSGTCLHARLVYGGNERPQSGVSGSSLCRRAGAGSAGAGLPSAAGCSAGGERPGVHLAVPAPAPLGRGEEALLRQHLRRSAPVLVRVPGEHPPPGHHPPDRPVGAGLPPLPAPRCRHRSALTAPSAGATSP